MFVDRSEVIADNPPHLDCGIAVADLDGDGRFEAFVTGSGPNRLLAWRGGRLVALDEPVLADPERWARGVAAADLDGDGREELYVLNAPTAQERFADRLFDWQEGGWVDLFSLPRNADALDPTTGRSVIALDRDGDGRYGFFVANDGGPVRLYELDFDGFLDDRASRAGLAHAACGRSAVAGPLVSGRTDIYTANERGPNFLFVDQGDGTYREEARTRGVADPLEHGRGVALVDTPYGFGLVLGNWEGPYRLLVPGSQKYVDCTPPAMARPGRVRTVIAADFDNDGEVELFFHQHGEPNRLFARRPTGWVELDAGAARESDGPGTGAAVADFDGDGQLELLVCHGEASPQPLGLYACARSEHAWLRVLPLTRQGAPARGATVTITAGGRTQARVIDGGSGSCCQMEPVAHFGLGRLDAVERVAVRWPDGRCRIVEQPPVCTLLRVDHPRP